MSLRQLSSLPTTHDHVSRRCRRPMPTLTIRNYLGDMSICPVRTPPKVEPCQSSLQPAVRVDIGLRKKR